MTQTDNKVTIVKINFSRLVYNAPGDKELVKSSDTVENLFHFIDGFGKAHTLPGDVEVNLLKDLIQNIESDHCGIFQLYFYENLFGPRENSKIIAFKNLTRDTIQILLNELFFLYQNENKGMLNGYAKENNIDFNA